MNKYLPSCKIFGVKLKGSNISRNELIELYKDGRVILELRDLDQSGASQRKSDCEILGIPYLSLPCLGFKNFKFYRGINKTITDTESQFKLKLFNVDHGTQNEKYMSVDYFLSRVLGVET